MRIDRHGGAGVADNASSPAVANENTHPNCRLWKMSLLSVATTLLGAPLGRPSQPSPVLPDLAVQPRFVLLLLCLFIIACPIVKFIQRYILKADREPLTRGH